MYLYVICSLIYNSQDMQPAQVSIHKWMDKDVIKNEILPFVTTWIDLEGIMLREISQKQLYTLWFHLYVDSKKTNKQKQKNKQILKYRE